MMNENLWPYTNQSAVKASPDRRHSQVTEEGIDRLLATLLLGRSLIAELGGGNTFSGALAALSARAPDAAAVLKAGLDFVLVTLDGVTTREFRSAPFTRGLAQGAVPGIAQKRGHVAGKPALDNGPGLLLVMEMVNVALHLWSAGEYLLAARLIKGIDVCALAGGCVVDRATAATRPGAGGFLGRRGAGMSRLGGSVWAVSNGLDHSGNYQPPGLGSAISGVGVILLIIRGDVLALGHYVIASSSGLQVGLGLDLTLDLVKWPLDGGGRGQ